MPTSVENNSEAHLLSTPNRTTANISYSEDVSSPVSSSISSSSNLSGIEIPSHWRPETQYCIDRVLRHEMI